MKDALKTKRQLIEEIEALRRQIVELKEEEVKRKGAEEALQKQKEELQMIFDSVPALVFYKDLDNRALRVNKTWVQTIGLPEEQVIGRSVCDFFPKEEAEHYFKDDIEVITSGMPKRNIIETAETDKGRRWFSTDKFPFRDKEGNIVGIIGFALDITERKAAEEKVGDQLRFMQVLIDAVPTPIFYKNSQGVYQGCNAAFASMVGRPKEELVGKTLYDIWPRQLAEKYDEMDLALFREPGVQIYEYQTRVADGTLHDVIYHKATYEDASGSLAGLVGTIIDITERKHAEEALQRAEEKYRSIFENAAEGIFQSTPDGHYLSANPAFAHILGYDSPEELISTITDISHQIYVDPDRRFEFIHTMQEQDTIQNFEAQIRRKDKSTIWVSVNARTVRDSSGGMLYYEGFVQDVTERKSLETQLSHARKMEAIGRMSGSIAHDFNNILTAIIGYGNLLEMKMRDDDPLRTYVSHMRESSEKAAAITQGLLAFSRKQISNPKPVKLNAIITRVEKFLLRIIGEDITLKTLLTDKDVVLMADSGQIEHVFMNLAANAKDAMPEGGLLTIESELVTLGKEAIRARGGGKPGMYTLISIADTGTGMDERTKERIFEPFFTTKEMGKGTGLGLSIVYGIIKQHNGYIDVSSELGKGTTIGLYLPVIQAEVEETKPAAVPFPERGSETVLVAEDEDEVRGLIRAMLEEFGYTVIVAVDGEDAIHKFMEHRDKIQLLILDVIMPRKNGKEAYEAINRIRPDVKAFYISGYAGDIVYDSGIIKGELDLLTKPLLSTELLRKVREVLDR